MRLPSASPEDRRQAWRRILSQQYEWHEIHHWPALSPAISTGSRTQAPRVHALTDIYKCLYQGEFGIGHSISSPRMFQELLHRELQRPGESGNEPLLEPVSPTGAIVRVNLRPLRQLCPDLEGTGRRLTELCLASAASWHGEVENFLEALRLFQELNRQGELGAGGQILVFPPDLVESFLAQVEDFFRQYGTVPVLSHSSNYRRLNRPSYRVVVWELLQQSPLAALWRGH